MNDSQLVLIAEDDSKVAQVLQGHLHQERFRTYHVNDGAQVAECARRQRPALILLDLTLRGRDGMAVLRDVRGFSDLPVIMLSSRVDEEHRLQGIEEGADDFICKPFSPREVVARVKAVLRRARSEPSAPTQAAPGLSLEEERLLARWESQEAQLTPVEFRLLKTLSAQPGRVFSRDHLLNRIYPDHRVVTDRTVDSHVKNLRRKLRALVPSDQMEAIRSVYGVGYTFAL